MTIYKGGEEVDNIYVGTQKIDKVYVGENLVYESGIVVDNCYHRYYDDDVSTIQPPEKINTKNCTDFSSMFAFSDALIKVKSFNTSSGINFNGMFSGCKNLTTIPRFDTSSGTEFQGTFNGCTSLTTIPTLNTQNAENLTAMFNGCTSLTTIPPLDVSSLSKILSTNTMFKNCASLNEVTFSGNKIPPFGTDMFAGSGITPTTGKIRVPNNLLSEWKTYGNWVEYASRMEGY